MDVIDRVPKLGYRAAHLRQRMRDKLTEHAHYIYPPRRRPTGSSRLGVAG